MQAEKLGVPYKVVVNDATVFNGINDLQMLLVDIGHLGNWYRFTVACMNTGQILAEYTPNSLPKGVHVTVKEYSSYLSSQAETTITG